MEQNLIYTTTLTITDTQTDCFGYLRPSALLEITQQVAGDHARVLGLGRETLEPRGLFWAIVRQNLEIHRLPRQGETVTVRTWPGKPTRTAFPRHVELVDEEEKLLCQVTALWLFMNIHTRAMVLPGKSGISVPGITLGRELPAPGSILPQEPANMERRTVRYSELDCNGHLSNTRYANWMEDLLPLDFHRQHRLRRLHICYLNEALAGQELQLHWELSGETLQLEARWQEQQQAHRVFALRADYA